MAEKVIVSEQWKVSVIEWLKSAGYAVGTSVLFELQKYIDKGNLNIDWKQMGMVALGTFILFVGGKFVAKPTVKTVYSNNAQALNVAEDIKESNR
jgi:hypothetical protein